MAAQLSGGHTVWATKSQKEDVRPSMAPFSIKFVNKSGSLFRKQDEDASAGNASAGSSSNGHQDCTDPSAPLGKPKNSGKGFAVFLKAFEGPSSSTVRTLTEKGETCVDLVAFTQNTSLILSAVSSFTSTFSKATFAQTPTCIDVNRKLASSERIDIVVGFVTGDIIWIDMISGRFSRFNKNGALVGAADAVPTFAPERPLVNGAPIPTAQILPTHIPSTPAAQNNAPAAPASVNLANSVHAVQWLSNNDIASVHENGCLALWDAEREDAPSPFPVNKITGPIVEPPKDIVLKLPVYSVPVDVPPASPRHDIAALFRNGGFLISQDSRKQSKGKTNPSSVWSLSSRPLSGLASGTASPSCTLLCVAARDGCMRIVDAQNRLLLDVYATYFGNPLCVAWSRDALFLVVGGSDNIISVYAPREQRLIARCVGHRSFVTHLAFDESSSAGVSRFVSVGDDRQVILWDMSYASLQRPPVKLTYSTVVLSPAASDVRTTYDGPLIDIRGITRPSVPVYHPVPSSYAVPVLTPRRVFSFEEDVVCAEFLPSGLVLQFASGLVRFFSRAQVSG